VDKGNWELKKLHDEKFTKQLTYIAILESSVDLVCKSLMHKIYTIMLE
jgi:hypothetical protein